MEELTLCFKNTITILISIFGLVSLLFIMAVTFKSMWQALTGQITEIDDDEDEDDDDE